MKRLVASLTSSPPVSGSHPAYPSLALAHSPDPHPGLRPLQAQAASALRPLCPIHPQPPISPTTPLIAESGDLFSSSYFLLLLDVSRSW